jgi:putative two-component system response regulator
VPFDNRYEARIMVVDDEPANVLIVTRLLERHGYQHIAGFTDPLAALEAFDAEHPDLVVLDLHMPRLDGYGFMNALDERVPEGSYLPVLVLTADVTPEARTRSFRSGARDFMTKPTDAVELGFRVASLLETRLLNLRLQDAVRATPTLSSMPPPPPAFAPPTPGTAIGTTAAQTATGTGRLVLAPPIEAEIERLLRALTVVDDEPAAVNQRVAQLSAALAAAAGCAPVFVQQLERAAELHDVGKIAVPQFLLQSHGDLEPHERRQVELHPERGAAFLQELPDDPTVALASVVALTHHERWDGTGYPNAMAGEEIPLAGRIVAIADGYATASRLAPEGSWAARTALGKVRAGAGSAFDPGLVEVFVRLQEDRYRSAQAG